MLKLLRENTFIREFDLDGTRFIDSKYRNHEIPLEAEFFIDQWYTADESLRMDMEASFAEYPARNETEVDRIIQFVSTIDPTRASRMRVLSTRQLDFPEPEHLRQIVEIYKAARKRDEWKLVGDNRWFLVLQSIDGLRIEPKSDCRDLPPSKEELHALAEALPLGTYRCGVESVCRDPSLLQP
jgi:hypothetical protein